MRVDVTYSEYLLFCSGCDETVELRVGDSYSLEELTGAILSEASDEGWDDDRCPRCAQSDREVEVVDDLNDF